MSSTTIARDILSIFRQSRIRATQLSAIRAKKSDTVTLVDVDFAEYRRKNDMRAVKKNCTIPSWLSYEAEKAGINFSATLQTALKQELHIVK